jgi:hypothetical protein
MKTFSLTALCLMSTMAFSQQSDDYAMTYTTTGMELIFSFADIQQNGVSTKSSLRFAPVVNIQSMVHFDFTEQVGMYSGFALRNVGYRTNDYLNPADGVV